MPKKLTFEHVKSFIELEGYQLLSDNYKNAYTKLLLKCPIGHEYKAKFLTFYQGCRCPTCGFASMAKKQKHSYDYIKNFIESEGYQLLSDNYKNAKTKLLLKCPIGHDYKIKFNDFQQGHRCSLCNKQTSKGEQDLALYIESLGIQIIKNDRSVLVNPLTGKNLELDIYIPLLNKAIEYNGMYWHSFLDRQKNDAIKREQCKKLNIDLLTVNEKNWLNSQEVEKSVVKKFIKGEVNEY